MTIYRTINSTDMPQLVGLLQQLGYSATVEEISERIETITTILRGTVIVAEDDRGKLIGCIQASVDTRLAEGTFGEIVSLVVDADTRGQGVGKKLIAEATTWLVASGCSTLRVRCNSKRSEAHVFYQRLGFQEIKSQKIFEKRIG
jgi:GNAT superfamily N-acetyltransferase